MTGTLAPQSRSSSSVRPQPDRRPRVPWREAQALSRRASLFPGRENTRWNQPDRRASNSGLSAMRAHGVNLHFIGLRCVFQRAYTAFAQPRSPLCALTVPTILMRMAQIVQPITLPEVAGYQAGKKALLIFFETDCPTCQLALPYFNSLAGESLQVIGISQDDEATTRRLVHDLGIRYPVHVDHKLALSRAYDPQSVPTPFLLDQSAQVQGTLDGIPTK